MSGTARQGAFGQRRRGGIRSSCTRDDWRQREAPVPSGSDEGTRPIDGDNSARSWGHAGGRQMAHIEV